MKTKSKMDRIPLLIKKPTSYLNKQDFLPFQKMEPRANLKNKNSQLRDKAIQEHLLVIMG